MPRPLPAIKVKAICAVTITFRSRTPPNAVPPRSRSDDTSESSPCLPGRRETAQNPRCHTCDKREEQETQIHARVQGVRRAVSARKERDESPHRKRSRRRPKQSPQQARSAGSRQEAAAPAARATRPAPALCQSHAHAPTRAPGTVRRHSNKPDPAILRSPRIAPTTVPQPPPESGMTLRRRSEHD